MNPIPSFEERARRSVVSAMCWRVFHFETSKDWQARHAACGFERAGIPTHELSRLVFEHGAWIGGICRVTSLISPSHTAHLWRMGQKSARQTDREGRNRNEKTLLRNRNNRTNLYTFVATLRIRLTEYLVWSITRQSASQAYGVIIPSIEGAGS